MMAFGSATSRVANAEDAGAHVIHQLVARDMQAADWIALFATRHHAGKLPAIRDQIADALAPGIITAVTAGGVISQRQELEDDQPGLTALAGRLPGVRLSPFRFEYADWSDITDSPGALREAIPVSRHAGKLQAIFMLAEARTTPILRLLGGFDDSFAQVPLIGGLVSAGPHPRHTRLCIDQAEQTFGAVGIALAGPVGTSSSISQGCRAIGRAMVITQAQGQVIEKLGGQNALAVIREIVAGLDAHDHQLIHDHGLHIGRVVDEYRPRFGRHDFLIRSITAVDDENGSVTVGDREIGVGQTVQLQVRDPAVATDDFAMALAAQKLHGPGRGALMFSCSGRGTRLFDHAHADLRQVNCSLGAMPIAGAFTAGQFASLHGRHVVQGHAVSLSVFRCGYDADGHSPLADRHEP